MPPRRKRAHPADPPCVPREAELQQLRRELAFCRQTAAHERADLIEAQRELEASRHRYVDLYDFAPVGYATLDRNGCLRDINLQGAAMLQRKRPHLVGRPILPLWTKEDRKEWLNHLSRLRRGKMVEKVTELRLAVKNGPPKILQLQLARSHRDGETIPFLRMAILDVTAERQAEAAVRGSERRFRALIENAAETITILDADGIVRYQSPSITAMLGYPAEEIVGQDAFALVHPEGLPLMRSLVDEVRRAPGVVRHAELRVRHQDGSWRWVNINAQNLIADPAVGGIVLNARDVTERREAEQALHASEERYRTVANFTYDWEYWTGVDGRFLYVSPSCERVTGYPPSAFLDNPRLLETILHSEDRDAVLHDPHELAPAGGGHASEFRIVRRDGRVRWIGHACQPVLAPDGRLLGVRGTNRDITARRQAEMALRESEQRLAIATSSTQIGIFDWNVATGEIAATEQTSRLLGLRTTTTTTTTTTLSQSYHYRDWAARVHPEDLGSVEAEIARSRAQRQPLEVEYRVVWPDGSPHWIAVRSVFEYDAQGAATRLLGVVMDITARKKAEEARQGAEQRYRLVGELIPFGVWETDAEGNATHLSRMFLELTGQTLAEHRRAWQTLIHAEDLDPLVAAWRECVRTGSLWEREFRIRGRDGNHRAILARGMPVRNAAGAVTSYVGINFDITEHHRTEEALRASLQEKEVLLQEVHHRVKNNLQVISSLISLQADAVADSALRGQFDGLGDQVRAMALVHEKLYRSDDLGRVELAGYARSLLDHLWRAHGAVAAHVTLACDIDPVSLPVTTAVPCGLILNELAANSLKHAFRGRPAGGAVTVSLRRAPGGPICLRVADDGVGLPDGADWRQAKSLGLRLVQMLTRQLEGTIEARCVPGGGTEFELVFQHPPAPPPAGTGP